LSLQKYQARLGFWQAIWGTLVMGGIAVAIPAAVETYKAKLDVQKTQEEQKLKQQEIALKEKEIEGKILDSHQTYISNFLSTALNQDIELRIRFSEYFSSVSDAKHREGWEKFRNALVERRERMREQINSKEIELGRLRAQRGNITAQQQME